MKYLDYIDDCIDVAGAKHKLSESYIGETVAGLIL